MGKQDFNFLNDIGTSDRGLKKFPPSSLAGVLESYGTKAVNAMKANLKKSNASQKLSQSIRFDIKILGDIYNFTIRLEDYYIYVDKDTKPHWLPYDPVTKTFPALNSNKPPFGWLQNKKSIKIKDKFNIDKQRGLAFMIAAKIAAKGTKGNRFFSKVVNDKSLKQLKTEITKAIGKDVTIAIKVIADDFKKK